MIITKLSRKDFEEILNNYNIGKYESHRHIPRALETTCYKLRTSKGIFILKVFEDAKPISIKLQLKVMALLTEKKFDTPPLIKTRIGRNYIIYRNKYIFIQTYFAGKHTSRFRNNEVYLLGIDIAKLHNLLSKLKVSGFSKHICLSKRKYNKQSEKFHLGIDYLKLNNLIGKLDFRKLKIGLIHSDLTPANLLRSKQGKLVFIDWADMHKDIYIYELAIFIAHVLIKNKKIYKNQIKLLIKGYETLRKLNSEEKKAMYIAVCWRLLSVIDWCIEQMKRHPDMKSKLKTWVDAVIKKQNLFARWSIEEFLENLK